jgi:hypothetical protein
MEVGLDVVLEKLNETVSILLDIMGQKEIHGRRLLSLKA